MEENQKVNNIQEKEAPDDIDIVEIYPGASSFEEPEKKFEKEVSDLFTSMLKGKEEHKKMMELQFQPLIRMMNLMIMSNEELKKQIGLPYKSFVACFKFMEEHAKNMANGMSAICVDSFQMSLWIEEYYQKEDKEEVRKSLKEKAEAEEKAAKRKAEADAKAKKKKEKEEKAKKKAEAEKAQMSMELETTPTPTSNEETEAKENEAKAEETKAEAETETIMESAEQDKVPVETKAPEIVTEPEPVKVEEPVINELKQTSSISLDDMFAKLRAEEESQFSLFDYI